MNNEMKFEKNDLLIPNGALEELGLVGISLSAWLGPHSAHAAGNDGAAAAARTGGLVSGLRGAAGCAAGGVQEALRRRL